MNTKTCIFAAFAIVATLSTASAFAGEASYDYPVVYPSVVSRADVSAEAVRARAAGLIAQGESSVVVADSGPALSRAQVKAETLEAIRVGAIGHREKDVAPTARQLESIRLAGVKALEMTVAAR
jgi:hypothetical protein